MRKVVVNTTPIIALIDKAKPVMDRLIQNGLYVSPEVQLSVLKIAGE